MGFLSSLFGGTPAVPPWQNIYLNQQQGAATSANQAALPGLTSLASGVDLFNQDQMTALLNSIMPGWSGSADTASGNIASELKGQIPADVSMTVQSSDAAKALTGGFGGSGLAGDLTARDLGLTSLDLTSTGTSSLESWTGLVDKLFEPGMFNVSSMFVTPQQEFQDTMQNQEQAWNAKWMQSQVSAMPDPVFSGIMNLATGTDVFKEVGSAYGGSGPWGGGGTGVSASQSSAMTSEFYGGGAAGMTGSGADAAGGSAYGG